MRYNSQRVLFFVLNTCATADNVELIFQTCVFYRLYTDAAYIVTVRRRKCDIAHKCLWFLRGFGIIIGLLMQLHLIRCCNYLDQACFSHMTGNEEKLFKNKDNAGNKKHNFWIKIKNSVLNNWVGKLFIISLYYITFYVILCNKNILIVINLQFLFL